MLPGTTILYRHVEAAHTVKDRPALVLAVVEGHMLLVIGQTAEPRGAHVLVDEPSARLTHGTYFDCEAVLAAPLDRVQRQLGRVRPATFRRIEEACAGAIASTAEAVREDVRRKRQHFTAKIQRWAEDSDLSFDDAINCIADTARLPRLTLREIVSGSALWTRDVLVGIADVLAVEPETLVEGDEPGDPSG